MSGGKLVPFVSFGNDELDVAEEMNIGDKIPCLRCHRTHKVDGGVDTKTGSKSSLLLFYKCGRDVFLAGVSGKSVITTTAGKEE